MTLLEIVADYKKKHISRHEEEVSYFRKQNHIEDAIKLAALSVSPTGKRFSHQRRIPKVILHKAYERIKKIQKQIVQVNNFDDLYDLIFMTIGSVEGIGPLCVYDFSMRIGVYLNIEPDKVFLQAGALAGAKNLGFKITDNKVEISDLPKEFRSLKPSFIEDILCIYKDVFKGISKLSKGC